MLAPCAGIIVFNKDWTILVSTKYKNYSFPKGKRNKNESTIDAAWRELQEETGLTKNDVELINDFTINEHNDKGNLSITYFVGKLIKNVDELIFDANELENSEWFNVNTVYKLKKLKDRRKDILRQAYEKVFDV